MTTMIFSALIIGVTLGLLGSGGSILTVPILVYMMGHEGKVAIAESLAIVGGIALVGMIPYARSGQVDWRSVVFFGLPGMAGTYLGAWLAKYVPDAAQLIMFSLVMLVAAMVMFRSRQREEGEETSFKRGKLWKIALDGIVVGIVTGLVGVGGGFLIVPALALLGGLPMRLAVGTSLAVIALKSGSGFLKYIGVLHAMHAHIDVRTVAVFTLVGIAGTLVGQRLSQRINQTQLKKTFAVFLVVMACFVLVKETPRLMALGAAKSEVRVSAVAPVQS